MFSLTELRLLKAILEEKAVQKMDEHMFLGTSLQDIKNELAPYALIAQKVIRATELQEIKIGDKVIVSDPLDGDFWNNGFVGFVIAEKKGNLFVVRDQDGDCWDIEESRLEKVDEEA